MGVSWFCVERFVAFSGGYCCVDGCALVIFIVSGLTVTTSRPCAEFGMLRV